MSAELNQRGGIQDTGMIGTDKISSPGQPTNRTVRVDSHLGDENWVGKLTLQYWESDRLPSVRVIPFFENPVIIESQNPRYMNYAVIGRSSNLFGYLGADSRKFNLSFKLNLPHITSLLKQYSNLWSTPPTKLQKRRDMLESDNESQAIRETEGRANSKKVGSFAQEVTGIGTAQRMQGATQARDAKSNQVKNNAQLDQISDKEKHFGGVAVEFDEEYEKLLGGTPAGNLQKYLSYDSPAYDLNKDFAKLRRSTINQVVSLIASIRSTVVNNTVHPEFGPPLVRLDWGILYRDVPCVCKGYTINVNDKAGYDKKTLLPRVLEVTMSLEETRKLQDVAGVSQDDLKGWEILVGTDQNPGLTSDPGNFKGWQNE
tara:strand:- start:3121 stop:4236 length:1116 start_codon:yes stop_codon:yes gene_type:complete